MDGYYDFSNPFNETNSFQRIFCEFMLENIFYRKDSMYKSYKPEKGDKIECENIPVYSFRYKLAFNKSEETAYFKKITKKHAKASILSDISEYL